MRKPVNILQSLELRPFVAGFRAESAAFWFLCFYIMLEYIHPQAMYPALNFIPWGQTGILVCLASVFITNSKATGFGAMDKMFILFSILVIISGIFAFDIDTSLKYWTTFLSWMLMYFCVVSILTTPNRILLFVLFFILINFKLSQHGARIFTLRGFSFARYGIAGPPGWFHNSGEFTLQMVVAFSISFSLIVALKEHIKSSLRWYILIILFPGTAALTVIGASSRGGQIALAIVLLIFALTGKKFFRNLIIFSTLAFVGFHLLPEEQTSRFNTMGDDSTSQHRLTHWENAIDAIKNNPLGVGYKNWIPYYARNYRPEIVQEIHNSVLEVFVDLGFPGGFLFLFMVLVSFIMNARTKKEMTKIGGAEGKSLAAIATGINLGLLGTFIAALFMSVTYYPVYWLAFAMTSALRHISQYKMKELKKTAL